MPAKRTKVTRIDTDSVKNKLRLRNQQAETKLRKKHPIASEFFDQNGLRPGGVRMHAAKLLSSGILTRSLLLSQHSPTQPVNNLQAYKNESVSFAFSQMDLATKLQNVLPPVGEWKLSAEQEKTISEDIKQAYGINATPELEGNRLNHDYGRMGAEQHLPRFPGDTIAQHDELQEKGITPGRGAWGYFAYSQNEMTEELYQTEKWYVAVQTLYLPNWNTDTARLRDWYKYRRVVVVNPANGKAVVAAVADAGPAEFTGKHFGGSPEVMSYLNINTGMQNHPVVLFFLDDPEKQVPLGPVEYNRKLEQAQLIAKS